ncbi:MAG TPA: SUKH-4 family immunity protein [Pseudonocardiaceae bacterium]|jgi:hypothetical protein|nr:SUKH-4 family immunity protein [Pseudonocardiaceae bacterium]
MTELDERAAALRVALAATPGAVRFAKIPDGAVDVPADLPAELRELLAASDGPRCGSIVVFSVAELPDNQFYCEDVDGAEAEWICFGMIDDNPLYLNRSSGAVWWFPDGVEGRMNGDIERFADSLVVAVERYLFGLGYAEVVTGGDQDRWYAFLWTQTTDQL